MRRYALIAGVDIYKDPAILDLECAENDCIELAGILRHAVKYDKVELLRGASSTCIVDAAAEMAQSLGTGDLFLFYFAGHGIAHEGRHLLLCPEARYTRLKYLQQTIPVDLLKEETKQAGLHRVFILDACRNNLLTERSGSASGLENERGLRDIVTVSEAPGEEGSLAILCSCSEKQTAGEIKHLKQGLFTAALLEVVKTAVDKKTELRLSDDLESDLKMRMQQLAKEHGLPQHQRPWIQHSGPAPVIVSGRSRGREESAGKTTADRREHVVVRERTQPKSSIQTYRGKNGTRGWRRKCASLLKHVIAVAFLCLVIAVIVGSGYLGVKKSITVPSIVLAVGGYFGFLAVCKRQSRLLKELMDDAEDGSAYSQWLLAYRYETGKGVAKDLCEAARWYQKAAEQDDEVAQFAQQSLGMCYEWGRGVAKDPGEAAKWYRRAAEQDYTVAQQSLGRCYEEGKGVVKDISEAVKWYRKAAAKGDKSAREYLKRFEGRG